MAVSDRMVLLVRALAVFGLNAVLGLAASAASGAAAAVTFGWLVPMTAVCALALAAATLSPVGERGRGGGPGRLGDHGAVRPGRRRPVHRRVHRLRPRPSLPGLRGVLRRDRRVCDPDPERNAMNIEIDGPDPAVRPDPGRGRGGPAGRPGGVRAARPERGRQDVAAADDGHGDPADLGPPAAARTATRVPTGRAGRSGAGSATCRRTSATTRASRSWSSSSTSRC